MMEIEGIAQAVSSYVCISTSSVALEFCHPFICLFLVRMSFLLSSATTLNSYCQLCKLLLCSTAPPRHMGEGNFAAPVCDLKQLFVSELKILTTVFVVSFKCKCEACASNVQFNYSLVFLPNLSYVSRYWRGVLLLNGLFLFWGEGMCLDSFCSFKTSHLFCGQCWNWLTCEASKEVTS